MPNDSKVSSHVLFRLLSRCVCGTFVLLALLLVLSGATGTAADDAAANWTFRLRFPSKVHEGSYSGRVYVFLSEHEEEPRRGPHWFRPEPFLAVDVEDWHPDAELTIRLDDPRTIRYPASMTAGELSELLDGDWRAQAVARFNGWERRVGTGVGNGYSAAVALEEPGAIDLEVTRLVRQQPFPESEHTREFTVPSERLTDFYGHPVELRAAVSLPASYFAEPGRRYPVIFIVPGFGGTHRYGLRAEPHPEKNARGVEFIRVTLDPSCPLGHHVFADSDNNGPWGTALVTEFLPALDRTFRTVPASDARFLTGHSSGGWSTLWLQVTYPDVFGGCWSTAPDPVDLSDFQRIDVYAAGENMYVDESGARRPLARRNGEVLLWYDEFCQMEDALGPGGQLHSFEAVFGPRGADGRPVLLWDRTTGEIDTQVAATWERYDIRRILAKNWRTLGPRLAGKLHLFMGTEDTFYLEGATRNLKEELARLGRDAVVELVPGADHFTLMTPALRKRIEEEMAAAYRERFPAE